MKTFILSLILFPVVAFAGNGSGNVSNVVATCMMASNLSSGGSGPAFGVTASSLSQYKVLVASATASAAASLFYGFHDMSNLTGAGSYYAPVSGKKFYGQCMCVSAPINTTGVLTFQHGETTGTLNPGTSTVPTGGTTYYQTGAASQAGWNIAFVTAGTASTPGAQCQAMPFAFDGTYTSFIQGASSGNTASGTYLNPGMVVYAVGVEQ